MSDISEWAEQTQKEVYQYWKSNHEDWVNGFQVFYGPVKEDAEILILGFQPGGSESSFENDYQRFEDGDFSIPDNHHYLNPNFPLAREMKKILGNSDDVIQNSVKSNVNFFRAPGQDEWSNLPDQRRQEMENFCKDHVLELEEKINPKLIIAEGMATWDRIQELFEIADGDCSYRGKERLICVSEENNRAHLGLMHPSGARIRDKDRNRMRDRVGEILDEYTTVAPSSY